MYSMINIWSIMLLLLYLTKAVKRLNSKCSHHKEFFLCFKNLYIYIYVYEMFTKLTCSINHCSIMIWLMLYPLHLSVLYVNYILNKLAKRFQAIERFLIVIIVRRLKWLFTFLGKIEENKYFILIPELLNIYVL